MDSETLTTAVIIAKLIVEEISNNPPYECVVNTADILNITVEQVYGFIRLYNRVQVQMII